jgi:thioredoxin-related protein
MKSLPLAERSPRFFLSAIVTIFFSFSPFTLAQAQDSAIHWRSMKEAQELAHKNGKKVIVFAEVKWSVYCKRMKNKVFPTQAVIDSLKHYFYAVKINISSTKPMVYNGKKTTPKEFAQHNHIQAAPAFFFMDKNGKKLGIQPGFISAKKFSRLIGYIGSGAYQRMEFKTYLERYAGQ